MRVLGSAATFAIGAEGQPGDRVFMFQIAAAEEVVTIVAEKFQVAAFALRARELLAEIGFLDAGTSLAVDLAPPFEPDFRVGDMVLNYRESTGLIVVELEPSSGSDASGIEFTVTPAQLDAAVSHGADAVEGGRPKCPRCGLAMDPDGHPCPSTNGNLRGHRP